MRPVYWVPAGAAIGAVRGSVARGLLLGVGAAAVTGLVMLLLLLVGTRAPAAGASEPSAARRLDPAVPVGMLALPLVTVPFLGLGASRGWVLVLALLVLIGMLMSLDRLSRRWRG
ncbi:MAG: hypothetical protein M3P95_03575 [Actinomycetota bacterium]|jgi:hypothetical protein|nr:hypothetical protein [Actinomycetota bacterium]